MCYTGSRHLTSSTPPNSSQLFPPRMSSSDALAQVVVSEARPSIVLTCGGVGVALHSSRGSVDSTLPRDSVHEVRPSRTATKPCIRMYTGSCQHANILPMVQETYSAEPGEQSPCSTPSLPPQSPPPPCPARRRRPSQSSTCPEQPSPGTDQPRKRDREGESRWPTDLLDVSYHDHLESLTKGRLMLLRNRISSTMMADVMA